MNTLITKEDIPNDSEYQENLVILIGWAKKSYPDFFFNFLCGEFADETFRGK
jgi:hypothetical protein